MQIGKRRGTIVLNVASASHLTGGSARNQDREIGMIVCVGISHTAAVEEQGMVEQISIRFRSRFQFFQKKGGKTKR